MTTLEPDLGRVRAELRSALKDCGSLHQLRPREAMALPESLYETLSPESVVAVAGRAELDPDLLAEKVEDPAQPLPSRWLAGQLLALIGDPRIVPGAPRMCTVPGGTFRMGTEERELDQLVARYSEVGVRRGWLAKECPAHEVTLAGFRMMRYPVTNVEWRDYCLYGGGPLPASWPLGVYPLTLGNHPVHSISAAAADGYARWLSAQTGRSFRLPTEAEWEYAARGVDHREFPWGDEWRPGAANTVEEGPLSTTPVGMYRSGASPFGVLDLAGNVEEFTATEYGPYPGADPVADDLVASLGPYRVARGGSWTRFADLARCARRHGAYPGELYVVGFRLVEDMSERSPNTW